MNNYQSPLQPILPQAAGQRKNWGRLQGCSKALAIYSAARQYGKPVVLITADPASAAGLQEDIAFFHAGDPALQLLSFPDWETLPYDNFSPYQDITSERLATLTALQTLERAAILIVPVSTLMHRLLPQDYLRANSMQLAGGDQIQFEQFRAELTSYGYRHLQQVTEHGDFVIRGSILDLYPMGAAQPYRIDLFDQEIDSIRTFDIETQRSIETVHRINILPARETPMSADYIEQFRSNWRDCFPGNPNDCPIYTDVSNGIAPAGIEYYLPLFFQQTATFFDYLPADSLLILDEGTQRAAEDFHDVVEMRYEQARHDVSRPVLQPTAMFVAVETLNSHIGKFKVVHAGSAARDEAAASVNFACKTAVKLPVNVAADSPFAIFNRFVDDYPGRILLVAETTGRREVLLELLGKQGKRPEVVDNWQAFLDSNVDYALTVAPLELGTELEDPAIAIISETQLFGERVKQRRLRKRNRQRTDAIVRNLTELSPGAPVVHTEHGVGRYLGLKTLTIDDIPGEFIQLEYADGDKLYVPVAALDQISRFTGTDPEHTPLHKLGSGQWQKACRKAAQKAYDVAVELLDLHARRAARQGYAFEIAEHLYQTFAQGFPFEETHGQTQAIDEVLADMRGAAPMDRLVCGDAGFGKTEVAMRAAFITVQNNKQVGVLVPTTLLAQQHHQNFRDRFADWPVRVEVLSRFISNSKQNEILRDLKQGKVDIVIGTHKLLQDTVAFRELGLLIIDEEHRFGVRQKEKFKALRAEVDVLTLTATPIPRSLNMALSDLRALSIIATPPLRRLPVKTFVREWTEALLKEALLREIKRGGQVYFLHNEVESIVAMAEKVERLIPEATVRIAHGQMPEKELERVMQDFYHRRFNILVCTTIIETGIDVPNANTIIVNRADKFGLAQLYQLRGRVGRSHHRAYAYLIVANKKAITEAATQRLAAIESLEDLGVGFTLATHDLEIRGAGEILGEEQSGRIQDVGFGMYMDLLERAVHSLRSGQPPELSQPASGGVDINLHIVALIPEDYVPDIHTRLIMYKRIAAAADERELYDLKEEFIDRFGMLPEPLQNLFQATTLKLRARPLGIRKIDVGKNGGRIWFGEHTDVDPAAIISLVSSSPDRYKLDGADKLRILDQLQDAEERIQMINELIDSIALKDAA
ncbi:MAG: transcription-repair coupling factor [Gammaproteobacteria bacterium]